MEFAVIIKNLSIISLLIITLLILLIILRFTFNIIRILVQKVPKMIICKYLLKPKWKYLVVFWELNLFMLYGLAIILVNKNTGAIVAPMYFLPPIIVSLITYYIKKERENTFSLIDAISSVLCKNRCLADLLERIRNQGNVIIILLVYTSFTVLIFTRLE